MKRALRILGSTILVLLAAVGVLLSLAFAFVSTDFGRALLVPRIVRIVDDAIAGSIAVRSFRLLPGGGLEVRDARVLDPDGDVVLEVGLLRLYVDVGRLRSRTIGFHGEIQSPALFLKREEDGSLSLARALKPTRPSQRTSGPPTWSVRVTRLALRGGSIRYVDAAGQTAFEAGGIAIDGRATYGPAGARLDASLRGTMTAPERAPLSLDVLGSLLGDQLRVRTLRAAVGDTALDVAATVDAKTWRGKVAVLALAVDAQQVHELLPKVPLASDIVGTLYADSDGKQATAALDLHPRGEDGAAEGALAIRLPPDALDAGARLVLHRLDASRILRGLPSTSIDLDARARGAGRDLTTLRGAVALSLAPSRFRGGRVGPAELRATADHGRVEVARLEAAAPGVTVRGQGRWSHGGGELAGHLVIDAPDLALARRNGELLAARPLPVLSGAARLDADLSGTQQAPAASVRITSPGLRYGSVEVGGVSLTGQAAGPLSSPSLDLDGIVARLAAGQLDARSLRLRARVAGNAGELDLTGAVPGLGPDALALRGAGQLSTDRRSLQLRSLTLAWPGDRFELQQPATVTLDGPSVDQLVLAAGPQRITLAGGLHGPSTRRTIDARLQLVRIDLALLPTAVIPPSLGLAGLVSADVTATGPPAAPEVAGRVELASAAAAGLDGLSAEGGVSYDGGRRRAHVALTARRTAGGELELDADLPVALGHAAGSAALKLDAVARRWPVPDLLRAAKVELAEPADGVAGIEVHLAGRVGTPTLRAEATLDRGRYGEFEAVAVTLRADATGTQLVVLGSADVARARALDVDGKIPLRLAEALRDPRAVVRKLRAAPFTLVASVPGFELATVAGRGAVPDDLRGRLQVRADLSGTLVAPRGTVTLTGSDVAYAGYQGILAQVTAAARGEATTLEAKVSIKGAELVRATAALALPVERLGHVQDREGAAIQARVDIQEVDLRHAASGAPVPLAGSVAGLATLAGTLGAPRLDVDLTGSRLEVANHPLGDLHLQGRAANGNTHAALHLAVTTGGTLDASIDAETDLSIDEFRRRTIAGAPARARVVADQLDLGFLPAVAPGFVRSAEGKLGVDVVAAGPLRRMVPRGTIALVGGKMSVAEIGEWTNVALAASLSDDAFRVTELSARHRDGKLSLTASVVGLAGNAPAELKAELRTEALTIPRAGQDLATIDLNATMTGKVSTQLLEAELTIPSATVKLPNRSPRKIQSLAERPDIVIGKPRRKPAALLAGSPGPAAEPFHARVHVLSPGRFFVKSDNPRMNIEFRADLFADYQEQLSLEGDVETVRGTIEPFGGRVFDLKSGRVHFTGGAPTSGTLEIQASYDNPTAKVNVAVTGTIEKPDIKLTSEPPMDEAQIALLIATGRTELKAGSGGIGTFTGGEAAQAALGAVATTVFKDVLADKLPVDTVSLDSSQLRAGKYLTDKIYVGYTRRFNANPEQGENTNEVRVEYQISRRWTFESRYGDAQSGGASLIWSKDY